MFRRLDEEIVNNLENTLKLTDLSIDLVHLYEKEFDYQILRTKRDHRRYTIQNMIY